VPQDMVIDIFSVIVKEGLKHEIIEVAENRSLLTVCVYHDQKIPRHQEVISNLKAMLSEYNEYRWDENEEMDWKED